MGDPNRILEGEAADPVSELERGLLSSLDHPEREQRRVWQRLSVQLGLGAATGALSHEAAAASAGKWLGLSAPAKLLVALAVSAPAASGIVYLVAQQREHAAGVDVAPPRAPNQPKQARGEDSAPPRSSVAKATPPPATSAHAPAVAPARGNAVSRSQVVPSEPDGAPALVEENRPLREARAAARSGAAQRALALLRELDARFPRGALLQEREVLRIQALEQAGSTDQARARARAFLHRYPESPYAKSLKRIAGLP